MDTNLGDAPKIAAPGRPKPLWRSRDYLLLWGGQGVSSAGTQASQLALPLLILAVTGSPAQAGILGSLRGLSYVLFGLPAGALVDRWNRKVVMVCCDTGRALALASIPLALIAGHLTVVQLYAVSFLEGTLFIFFSLAETACLTRVVTAAQIPAAISQNQATEAGATLIGPPLGGALFGAGRGLPFLADAVSYAVSAASILFIRTGLQSSRAETRRAIYAEVVAGVVWLRRRPNLYLLMWLIGGINLIFGGWSLVLIELAKRLGAGSAGIGLLFGVGGAGTILGALLTPFAQRRFSVGQLVIGMAWCFAITWPPYALAPSLFVLGAVNVLGFFSVPLFFGTVISYRLILTPDDLQGRVNSVFRLIAFGGTSLGFLLTGLLLEWFGPVATVWITMAPALALALLATFSASLRHAGRLAVSA